MKANQRLWKDTNAQTQMNAVVTVVALLLAIVIGVMVYFEVTESIDEFDVVTERFYGYTTPPVTDLEGGSNFTATVVTLKNSPYSTDNSTITVYCYNATGVVQSAPAVDINHKQISIPASPARGDGTPLAYTQINVTYTTNMADTEGSDVTPMAESVFGLLPIIALIIVAAIILAVVLGFGGSGRKGGGL